MLHQKNNQNAVAEIETTHLPQTLFHPAHLISMTNYERIEQAISYLQQNFRQQPSLDEVAAQVYLSPFHFQRLFTEWAGVSPKKFLQFTTVQYTKSLLQRQYSLFDASFEAGLSGSGRLHDLFLNIEGMTPGVYKAGGNLTINYNFYTTAFGTALAAATNVGLCYLHFVKDEASGLSQLQKAFPAAQLLRKTDDFQASALHFFQGQHHNLTQLKLHLKGTAFQLKVWQALLSVPSGNATTYASLAATVGSPQACRAVGSAVGANPVAFLIPCHRVIQSSGLLGGYHWGTNRKWAMLGWEAAALHAE